MKESKIIVSIDGVEFGLREAAQLLGEPMNTVNNLINRHKVFGWKGYKEIKRISAIQEKRGVSIYRKSDNKRWFSFKDLATDLKVSPLAISTAINKDKQFVHKGEVYEAPDYVRRKRVLKNPLRKHDITVVESGIPERIILKSEKEDTKVKTLVESKKGLATEEKAVEALKQLAVERINQAVYDKASLVLQALELLTKS